MGTVTTSIGTNTSIDTETPSSCALTGPWEVTFGTAPTGVSIGDQAAATDSFANVYKYLVQAVSGAVITLKYISGGMGSTSPCSVTDGFGAQAPFTFKRFYSTISSWESALDSTSLYSSSDDAVGECYDDSGVFAENITLNGGDTVGLDSVTLTVASGERHDGTAGNGVRIGESGAVIRIVDISNVTVEWLEIYNDEATVNTIVGIETSGNSETNNQIRNCIIHQIIGRNNYSHVYGILLAYGSPCDVLNCIIYDIDQPVSGGAGAARGITGHFNASHKVLNCTVHDIMATLDTLGKGVELQGVIQNSIATSVGGDCIEWDSAYSGAVSYNLSSDSTATGTGSLTSKTAANQFVSCCSGSINLHLKNNSDALRVGVDLGTSPTGVNFDIDNYDRDAEGSIWDIGADQCESCSTSAGTVVPQIMNTIKQMAGC